MPKILRVVARKVIAVLPKRLRKRLFSHYWTSRSPDRVFLVNRILPAIADMRSDVLWIGCQKYTREYPRILESKGGACWTLEIDPTCAQWGNEKRHVVGDVLNLEDYFGEQKFDAILCNGIFGFGVNSLGDQQKALSAMHQRLKPKGFLLLSWNTDRTADPFESGIVQPLFERHALPDLDSHYTFTNSSHVYEFLRKLG